MSSIKQQEVELSEYLSEWANARITAWDHFYRDVSEYRSTELYNYKGGREIMNTLEQLVSYVGDAFFCVDENSHIIPSKYSSVNALIRSINSMNNDYFRKRYHLIEQHFMGEQTYYIFSKMAEMLQEFDEMVKRCNDFYIESYPTPPAYIQAVSSLFDCNIPEFIDVMKSLIEDVPYSMHKEKINEGYFHTLFHVICSVIGLRPFSEEETANGRIDVRIECPNHILIFEFKFSKDDSDLSDDALKQIKENDYALRFHICAKPIYGIGVSYSNASKNINGHKSAQLYSPNFK